MNDFDIKKFLTENKLTTNSRLQELNLMQKGGGMFDTVKAWFSNLSPSGDGKEIKDELKKLGLDFNGLTIYDTVFNYLPEKPEYRLETANISDLSKKVKLSQYQIDNANLKVTFIVDQFILNISDEVPKIDEKRYALNLETGKYDFIKKSKKNLDIDDAKSMDASDVRGLRELINSPIKNISLEDLKHKASQKK